MPVILQKLCLNITLRTFKLYLLKMPVILQKLCLNITLRTFKLYLLKMLVILQKLCLNITLSTFRQYLWVLLDNIYEYLEQVNRVNKYIQTLFESIIWYKLKLKLQWTYQIFTSSYQGKRLIWVWIIKMSYQGKRLIWVWIIKISLWNIVYKDTVRLVLVFIIIRT